MPGMFNMIRFLQGRRMPPPFVMFILLLLMCLLLPWEHLPAFIHKRLNVLASLVTTLYFLDLVRSLFQWFRKGEKEDDEDD